MKYTNFVLTVIAVCLLCLVFRDVSVPTQARAALGQDAQQLYPVDVNIVKINGRAFGVGQVNDFKPSLPVVLSEK